MKNNNPSKASFEFARLQYMIYLRSIGKTNAQIARSVGISVTSVVKALGYQPAEINKVSFSKRGRKAAATRSLHKTQKLLLEKKADIEMIDMKIASLQAERDVKAKEMIAE